MDQDNSSSFLCTFYVIGMPELALGQLTGFIFFFYLLMTGQSSTICKITLGKAFIDVSGDLSKTISFCFSILGQSSVLWFVYFCFHVRLYSNILTFGHVLSAALLFFAIACSIMQLRLGSRNFYL